MVCMGWFRSRGVQRRPGVRRVSLSGPLAASIALAALTAIVSCDTGKTVPSASSHADSQDMPRMHQHVNGLQLRVSETLYRVSTTPEGFLIEPASGNDDRRDPLVISIRLLAGEPQVETNRSRMVDSRRSVRYSLVRDDEGG